MSALVTNENTPTIVQAMAFAMPPEWCVNPDDGQGTCIWAAKLAITILRREGIECKALACDLLAFNAEAKALIDSGNHDKSTWPCTAWSVGIWCDHKVPVTSKQEPYRKTKSFGGHLVVAGSDWFLDLTVAQVARPGRGIEAPGPMVGPIYPGGLSTRVDSPSGGALQWIWRPEWKSWRSSPAWRGDLSPLYLAKLRSKMAYLLEPA